MNRIPEPELMTDVEQAKAYACADFEQPHGEFIRLLQEVFPSDTLTGNVLDLGCGPGDITFRFVRAYPETRVVGVDGSKAMLDLANQTLTKNSALQDRVKFVEGYIPQVEVPKIHFDAIISNSLLHHFHEPESFWGYVKKQGGQDTQIFIMDLARPESELDARKLVEQYAADEVEILKTDFYNSLLAAFRPEEVVEQLNHIGLWELNVKTVSDRHLLVWGMLRTKD